MGQVRVLVRRDGIVQTQHRGDQRYDDTTLPLGTTPADIAREILVDEAALVDVEDTQAQLDIQDGRLIKNLDRKPVRLERAERRAAAAQVLEQLDEDPAVEPAIKRYLVALREHLNLGPTRIERPQPPAGSRQPQPDRS